MDKLKNNMKMVDLFLEEKGKPSIKRIVGSFMMANGILGKNALILYTIRHDVTGFDKIDGCLDNLIYCGVALLLGTIADKFFKKKL